MAKKVIPGSLTEAYKKREGDFSPDLVGYQFTKSSSVFTLGNFSITTNAEPLTGLVFNSGEFTDFFDLSSLNLTSTESEVIAEQSNSLAVKLNYNKTNTLNYAYFGNFKKFVESEITEIILKWKGSLYLEKNTISDTVVDFYYNTFNNKSYFRIPINTTQNVFNLKTTNDIPFSINEDDISYLAFSYDKYVINNDYGNFKVLNYTGNTVGYDYITVAVEGNVWPNLSGSSGSFTYHLRPNDQTMDKLVFSKLTEFQSEVLNRSRIPKYTIRLSTPRENSLGTEFNVIKELTWPTSDGFNIDISGRDYFEYLEELFQIAEDVDSDRSNIMVRKLIADAILEFDTEGDGTNRTGRKMDKLLKIWGREYDEVKKYINGISFANVITYDGVDNAPDELIKIMASTLGFDTIQSFSDNDLINYLVSTTGTIFSGTSKNLSIKEMDLELWRRLVINAWWLWKSKGTRKVIEFFLNLFQINECLVDLNEYVYLVENKLNRADVFNSLLDYTEVTLGSANPNEAIRLLDLSPIDEEGFPKILPNTPDYYFQMDGFWYDGGVPENFKSDTNGNNPHYGPYDFGRAYFNKFRCFVDDFQVVTQTINLNELTFNYFSDYSYGTIEGVESETILVGNQTVTNQQNTNTLTDYGFFYGGTMNNDGRVSSGTTILAAGSSSEQSNTGENSFQITFSTYDEESCKFCPNSIQFGSDGTITYQDNGDTLILRDEECCNLYGYENYFGTTVDNGVTDRPSYNCYWCPPLDYFIEIGPEACPEILAIGKDGVVLDENLEPISQECCQKLGKDASWDPNYGKGGACIDSNFVGGGTGPIKPVKPSVVYNNTTKKASPVKEIFYENSDGVLVRPNKECCKLRGYAWNSVTKKCVPKTIITYDGDIIIDIISNNSVD